MALVGLSVTKIKKHNAFASNVTGPDRVRLYEDIYSILFSVREFIAINQFSCS